VRTGRLLKFQRPGGDIHAYLYREGGVFHASVFVLASPARRATREPLRILTGETEARVESDLRAWIEANFPAPA
jgi:hypothetical protein